MAVPIDKELYEKAKAEIYKRYSKPSAYRSGALVKRYKELGGRYKDSPGGKPLKRWFQEDWKDVGDKDYPVYRPTKRVTSKTPLTVQEIDPKNLQQQIDRKQQIRGEENLKPFVGKGWENIYGRTGFHAGMFGGADKRPRSPSPASEEEDEDEDEDELAFICDDCNERIMRSPGDPAYDGRRNIDGYWYCGDCAPEHLDDRGGDPTLDAASDADTDDERERGGERPFNKPNKPVLNISEQDFFDPNFDVPAYYYNNPKQVVFWNNNYTNLKPNQRVDTAQGITFGSNLRTNKRNYVKGLDDNRDARMVNAVNPLPYETQPNITANETQTLKELRKRKFRRYAVMNDNQLQRVFPPNFLPPNYSGQNLSPSDVLRRNWLSALSFAANAINQQGPPPPPAGGPPPPPPPPPPGGDGGPSPSSSSSRSRSSLFSSFPRSPSLDFFRDRHDDNDLFRRSPNASVSVPRSDNLGSRSRSRN